MNSFSTSPSPDEGPQDDETGGAGTSRSSIILLIFTVLVVASASWYFVGGGRSVIERRLARAAGGEDSVSEQEAVEMVRGYLSGPQNLGVNDRLDKVCERLESHGISVSERSWSAVTESGKEGWLVTCVLRGPGYESRFEWTLDASGNAVQPRNGPARDLEQFDTAAGKSHVATWSETGSPKPGRKVPGGHPSGAAPPHKTEPAAHRDGDDISLVGVYTAGGVETALLSSPRGQTEAVVGGQIDGWKVREIRHRGGSAVAVVLVKGSEMRVARLNTQPAAGGAHAASSPAPGGPPPPRNAPETRQGTPGDGGPDPPVGVPNANPPGEPPPPPAGGPAQEPPKEGPPPGAPPPGASPEGAAGGG